MSGQAQGPGLRHGTWWDKLAKQMKEVQLESVMEGRFTRLFPHLPPASASDAALQELAAKMTADQEDAPTPEGQVDPEENQGIPAVYTYLGQFIDHDLTLDPTSHLKEFVQDVNALVDFRTPRFDLDNLYGRGPDDQPYMYQDGTHMLLGEPMSGNAFDSGAVQLPRGPNGRALIGDPRNDENRIVAQLQATMLRFHNKMADMMLAHDPNTSFEDIRNQVRWHYQWMVVTDFLPTVVNATTYADVWPDPRTPTFKIEALAGELDLMPVEFSVAAYRFGHSMIRPEYRLNADIARRPIFSKRVDDPAADLGGFRPIPSDWAIDWQFFIDLGDTAAEDALDDPIPRKPQMSYKIDSSLVSPLHDLPASVAANPSILAERNLLRGKAFKLPSGQSVARDLGETPIPSSQLMVGKATAEDQSAQVALDSIGGGEFTDHAPLWTYILCEAQVTSWAALPAGATDAEKDAAPVRLGPVGGRIVAEVFAALLKADQTSYLHQAGFSPRPEFTTNGSFGLADLINVALGRKG